MKLPTPPTLLSSWHFTVLDEPARLKSPEYLLLAGAVVLVGVLVMWAAWRRLGLASSLVSSRLTDKIIPGFAPSRTMTRLGCSIFSLILLSLALTQPQCGVGTRTVERAGIDLVVVFDASRSMLSTDIRPSRFERARMELSALLQELRGDRFGLVVFANTSIVQVPLTTDRRAAGMYLRAVHPDNMPVQGTNIGSGLRTAHRMLVENPGSRSQVVVLISDGEDHHGDAREMAKRLADDGIVIFTVGIGTVEGELLYLEGDSPGDRFLRDETGQPVVTRLDEELMRDIAAIGDGEYINTYGRGIGITEVMRAVRGMEQDEREVMEVIEYADQSVWLLLPGFLLLLAGAVIRPGKKRPVSSSATLLLLVGSCLALPGGAEARSVLQSEHPLVAEGNRAFAEERYDEALSSYEAALRDDLEPSQRAVVHYNRGTALATAGDLDEARKAFDASIALGEPKAQARDFYNLGTAMLLAGDPEGARDALVESLRRDPANRAAQHNLEIALRMLEEPPPDGDADDPDQDDGDPGEDAEEEEAAEPDGDDGDEEQDEEERDEDRDDEGEGDEDRGEQDDEEGDDEHESDQAEDDGDDESERDEEGRDEDEEGDDDAEADDEGDRDDDADHEDGEQEDESRDDEEGERDDEEREDDLDADAEDEQERSPEDGDDQELPTSPSDVEGLDEREAEPVEISEQDMEAILDALESRERPLQPFLFRPPAEMETAPPGGEDW